ncbi:MAG TPA: ATP-binding protein [Rhodocyclaceae bacterium]|nr:ATP-binding protein [Rhodocyclaceae bacterium]
MSGDNGPTPAAGGNLALRDAYYARQKYLFALAFVVVSIVPLLLLDFKTSRVYEESWMERAARELSTLAHDRKEIIDRFLGTQEDQLASLVALHGARELAQGTRLATLLGALDRNGAITDLGVIDAKGNHLAYQGPFARELAGRNYAGAPWFVEVMRSGRYVSDVFSGYRKVPHLVVAVADPARAGILRATIDLAFFNGLLQTADVGPDGDAFIVNRRGEMQTGSRIGRGRVTPEELERFSALADEGGNAARRGDTIHSAVYLNNRQWLLVLETNVESSLAPYEEARHRDTVLVAVAAAAIILVAVGLTHSMIGRLARAEHERNLLANQVGDVEKLALIGRLAASVAHEINNPLQLISGQTGLMDDLMEDERPDAVVHLGEYREALGKVRTQIARASTITRRLLGFSRGSDGRSVDTDVNQAVEETAALFEHEARRHRITIERHYQDGLPAVSLDPAQLQQVVLNVLHNAMDAIGQDGTITITSRVKEERVVVDFADTGPGLSIEVLEHLYDPFFTTKPKGKGTGLGLYVSHDIMARLGGELIAENRDGGGAVFSLELPAMQARANRFAEAVCM